MACVRVERLKAEHAKRLEQLKKLRALAEDKMKEKLSRTAACEAGMKRLEKNERKLSKKRKILESDKCVLLVSLQCNNSQLFLICVCISVCVYTNNSTNEHRKELSQLEHSVVKRKTHMLDCLETIFRIPELPSGNW